MWDDLNCPGQCPTQAFFSLNQALAWSSSSSLFRFFYFAPAVWSQQRPTCHAIGLFLRFHVAVAAMAPPGSRLVSACTRRGRRKDWICQGASTRGCPRSAAQCSCSAPRGLSLMGPTLTTDPNCLWAALHVLLVPDCLWAAVRGTAGDYCRNPKEEIHQRFIPITINLAAAST